MNFRTFKIALTIFIAAAASQLHAEDLWSGAQPVVSVQVLSQGGFIINLDGETDNACSMADGTSSYLVYPQQNSVTINGSKALLSTAMIAFSTGNKLNVMYTESAGYCWGQQLLLTK